MLTESQVVYRGMAIVGGFYGLLVIFLVAVSLVRKKPVEWVRLLSSLVIYVSLFFIIVLPPIVLTAFVALVSALGMREIYEVAKVKEEANVRPFFRYFSYASSLLLPFVFYAKTALVPFFLVVFVFILFAYPVLAQDPSRALDRGARALMGLIFTCFLSYLILIRKGEQGIAFGLFLVFVNNITDSAAYICGRIFGRRKLAPVISPGKTLEGAGLACVAAVLVGRLLNFYILPNLSPFRVAILALALGMVSQLGDIMLSVFKRDVGVKDYSRLIPSQGGVLDRFDSLVVAAPIFYYLLRALWG